MRSPAALTHRASLDVVDLVDVYVNLLWAELDPRRWQFEEAPVRTAVTAVVREYTASFDGLNAERRQVEAAIDRAISRIGWPVGLRVALVAQRAR